MIFKVDGWVIESAYQIMWKVFLDQIKIRSKSDEKNVMLGDPLFTLVPEVFSLSEAPKARAAARGASESKKTARTRDWYPLLYERYIYGELWRGLEIRFQAEIKGEEGFVSLPSGKKPRCTKE